MKRRTLLLSTVALIIGCASPEARPGPTATSTPVPATASPLATASEAPDVSGSASRVEDRTFASPTLGRAMPYFVFLPPGYDASAGASYPVLYMLHGMSGTNTEWRDLGLFTQADALMKTREVRPMIIVLPQGDDSYWVDHVNGPKWGTYTARDVVSEIDGRYRTLRQRERRAVGGLSMGAHGALQLALNFPDVYRVVGAHSLVLRPANALPDYFGGPSESRLRDPVMLAAAHPSIARELLISIDVGAQDSWLPAAKAFHDQLVREGVPHEWRTPPGEHTAEYWTAQIPNDLRFYSAALAGEWHAP
jgi:S-formylglutathione hydrolase FrmB